MSSCFTGVESTPRITYKEVKEKNAGTASPEEVLASSFVCEPFGEWKPGKRFFVTSPRISLVLSSDRHEAAMPAEGDTLIYAGRRTAADLLGKDVVELLFTMAGNPADTLAYRTNATLQELSSRPATDVAFTIDLDLVAKVRQALEGKTVFIKSPMWFTRDDKAVNGRKFVKVHIDDVLPANEIYPCKVLFTDDNHQPKAIFMSAGTGSRWTPREFGSLFSFTDPRNSYPAISDAVWLDIVNCRVSKGMTKTEATLALGTPRSIDRGHDQSSAYERWIYSDGVYLIFEDGLLIRFNK